MFLFIIFFASNSISFLFTALISHFLSYLYEQLKDQIIVWMKWRQSEGIGRSKTGQ